MINTVIFDVMGVIFVDGDDTNDLLAPYVKKINHNITTQEIVALYLQASLGKISAYDFWKSAGIEGKDIFAVQKTYLDSCLTLDKYIIQVFKELKGLGYKIGILSNDLGEWSLYLRKKWGIEEFIDYCVISSDVNMRKPDKSIYEYTVEKYELNPHECVFIDDRIKNLLPAKGVGFKTILFDREACGIGYDGGDTVKDSRDIISIVKRLNDRRHIIVK